MMMMMMMMMMGKGREEEKEGMVSTLSQTELFHPIYCSSSSSSSLPHLSLVLLASDPNWYDSLLPLPLLLFWQSEGSTTGCYIPYHPFPHGHHQR